MAGYASISRISLVILLASSAVAWGAGSPYGANGMGLMVEDMMGRARGMGGAGVANADGLSMLRSNPALLATFERPVYGFGMVYNRASTATERSGSFAFARTDPTLVRFVLPLRGKLFLGWGIAPFSRADAKIELPPVSEDDSFTDTMTSSGGVNVTSFEIAAKYKMFGAGASMNYYFGSIEEAWLRDFHGASDMNNTTDFMRKQYGGYGVTAGVFARLPLNAAIGLGYSTPTTMDVNVYLHPGNRDNPEQFLEKTESDIPARWRLGATTQLSERFSAAADFSRAEWAKAARTDKERLMYNNTYSLGVGVRYAPSTRPTSGYLSTIPLSAGVRTGTLYYKSYPKINAVRETAVTLGVELPFHNGFGGLITSWEIGKRGSKDDNGWDDTFFNVGFSLVGGIR